MQIDKSSLQDFLSEHWLWDATNTDEDIGYMAALAALVDWFGLDEPEG